MYFSVSHEPTIALPVDEPLEVNVKIRATSGIKWVRLRYRSVNQDLEYSTLPMSQTNEQDTYKAIIPANQLDGAYDMMYFVEIVDNNGKGFIYPDFNKEMPYIVRQVSR